MYHRLCFQTRKFSPPQPRHDLVDIILSVQPPWNRKKKKKRTVVTLTFSCSDRVFVSLRTLVPPEDRTPRREDKSGDMSERGAGERRMKETKRKEKEERKKKDE